MQRNFFFNENFSTGQNELINEDNIENDMQYNRTWFSCNISDLSFSLQFLLFIFKAIKNSIDHAMFSTIDHLTSL